MASTFILRAENVLEGARMLQNCPAFRYNQLSHCLMNRIVFGASVDDFVY